MWLGYFEKHSDTAFDGQDHATIQSQFSEPSFFLLSLGILLENVRYNGISKSTEIIWKLDVHK